MRSLPLRRRMTIAVAIAVAIAVVLAAFVAYFAVRGSLRGEVDQALQDQPLASRVPPDFRGPQPGFGRLPARQGGPTPYMQLIDSGDGVRVIGSEDVELPITTRAREVAAGVRERFFNDETVAGTRVRVLTVPLGDQLAVQLGRSLEPAEAVLARLRLIL